MSENPRKLKQEEPTEDIRYSTQTDPNFVLVKFKFKNLLNKVDIVLRSFQMGERNSKRNETVSKNLLNAVPTLSL